MILFPEFYSELLNFIFKGASTLFSIVIKSPISDISEKLGPNDLPYKIPIHPNLVHLTIGLSLIHI